MIHRKPHISESWFQNRYLRLTRNAYLANSKPQILLSFSVRLKDAKTHCKIWWQKKTSWSYLSNERRRGYGVGENRGARLMRENKLGRRVKKRFRSTTTSSHGLAAVENLVNREFDVAEPNLGLCSRKVIGWAMRSPMTAELMIRRLSWLVCAASRRME